MIRTTSPSTQRMKVALIPTGETEWAGLATALGRLFPVHDFVSLPLRADREEREPQLMSGFTSAALSVGHINEPPGNAIELLRRAAFEAIQTRNSETYYDLVVIIDDVELANREQTQVIIDVMRAAAQQFVRGELNGRKQAIAEKTLRDRVSFHLVCPMIEAWFFADPGALANAGVPAGTAPRLHAERDVEMFQTNDDAYSSADHCQCVVWHAEPPEKKNKAAFKKRRPKWAVSSQREHHPKGYLQWLCMDPHHINCTTYDETEKGAAALANLDWAQLAAHASPPSSGSELPVRQDRLRFVRALVDDLEGVLGPASVQFDAPPRGTPTALGQAPKDRVLRNI
jgi:hypothetical protein